MTTITINLNSSDYNSDVPVTELVHQSSYKALQEKIDKDLKEAQNSREGRQDGSAFFDKYPPGSGLVYFIDGTRGAGKSTFLRAAFKGLPGANHEDKNYAIKKLEPLAYIDPSRLENNEIVLLGILMALKEVVDKRKHTLRNEPSYTAFRENFKKLAGGLSLFAKDHHPLQHLDPELFLDHGLTCAGHSKDLRRNFHEVLDDACKLLGAEALLIAFDDADTNAAHAHKVLECIRNYLDTPRIVTLVTGDLELYSLLVRDYFFNNLGHSQYDKDDERHQQRVRMVDHLEDQYLLKLFPIQRRYQLRPLGSLLKGAQDGYFVAYENRFNGRAPDKAMDELIRRGLRIKNATVLTPYREFLLQQPLRSVLQLLSRCAPYLTEGDSDTVENGWKDELSEALRESLRAMALGSLYKFGVDVDALATQDLPALIDAVFELALLDGDSDTATYLRPQTKDESLKCCFTALAAEVAGQCAGKPSVAIRYLLGGPGGVSLFGQVSRRRPKDIDREVLLEQFRKYMGIGRNEDALDWARHASAILIAPGVKNSALVRFGVIGLHMRKPKSGSLLNSTDSKNPGCADFKPIKTAIATWKKGDKKSASGKTLPVIALSLMEVSGSGNRTYASIFNILGLIELLLRLDSTHLDSKHQEAKILEIIPKSYPSVSISCPEWEGNSPLFGASESEETNESASSKKKASDGGNDDEASGESQDDQEANQLEGMIPENTLEHLKILVAQLNVWLTQTRKFSQKIAPSAVLLGKIWIRLYFALEKVSEDRRRKIGTASLMEMFALCVINAFYVEEADHHLLNAKEDGQHSDLDRTNPLASPEKFYTKLHKIAELHEKLPLTYLIATCPLILGLLHPIKAQSAVGALLKAPSSRKLSMEKYLCDPSAWDLIEKTFMYGVTYTTDVNTSDEEKAKLTKALPKLNLASEPQGENPAQATKEINKQPSNPTITSGTIESQLPPKSDKG